MASVQSSPLSSSSNNSSDTATTMSATERQTLLEADYQYELKKFQHACQQLELINMQIDTLLQRQYRAQLRSMKKSLHLQIVVMEGVRNMFLEYCSRKADELDMIMDLMQGLPVDVNDDDDDDVDQQNNIMEELWDLDLLTLSM